MRRNESPPPPAAGAAPARDARAEPALVERARRLGWAALLLAVAAMAAGHWGPADWRPACTAIAIAMGLIGGLAIINVALVRSLYRQIDTGPQPGNGDQSR